MLEQIPEQDSVRAAMQKHIAPLFSGAGRTATQHWDVVEGSYSNGLMIADASLKSASFPRTLGAKAWTIRLPNQGIYGLPKQEESRT